MGAGTGLLSFRLERLDRQGSQLPVSEQGIITSAEIGSMRTGGKIEPGFGTLNFGE